MAVFDTTPTCFTADSGSIGYMNEHCIADRMLLHRGKKGKG